MNNLTLTHSVPALEFDQKGIRMYLFALEGNVLEKLFYARRRTSEDREGIQRELDPKRLKDIAKFIMTSGNVLPNSIVVNMSSEVVFERSKTIPNFGHLTFPYSEKPCGILLDGQHRLFGVVHQDSKEKDMKLAVTGLFLTDMQSAARIFVGINDNQKPVKKDLLIALQQQLGLLPSAKDKAAAITDHLNDDDDSPLKGRIKMFQDETKKLRKDQIIAIMSNYLTRTSDVLSRYSINTASDMLKVYLSAIADMFPEAWNDDKGHVLIRPAGLDVILPLFQIARESSLQISPTLGLTKEHYIQALQPIKDTPWDSKWFRDNRYTSAAGRKDLRQILANKLTSS